MTNSERKGCANIQDEIACCLDRLEKMTGANMSEQQALWMATDHLNRATEWLDNITIKLQQTKGV